ncbi:MAG: hypothetical protein JWO62_981, partial [Acidimicrobiaceae bacterium]|nr:hypothetical protein [Acidimicrobiaceae bacterium]
MSIGSRLRDHKEQPAARRRLHGSSTLAAFLVVAGTVGSAIGAAAVARANGQRSRQAFVVSSTEIASTLKLAIQHEEDLSVIAGAFVVRDPGATEAEFLQWTSSVRAFERYPELQGIAEVVIVPASKLSAFAKRAVAAPTGSLGYGGTFQVIPAGARPYYCLQTVSQSRDARVATPAALDYCKSALGPGLLTARDSGASAYEPYGTAKTAELAIGTPIYRGGTVPATV